MAAAAPKPVIGSPQAENPPAEDFGTVNSFGQSAEHEKITRAALACKGGEPSGTCFQPSSLNQLAGASGTFGAVGAPDSDEILDFEAHCDDADFLDRPGYPQSRSQATAALQACISHLKEDFRSGVNNAASIVSAGRIQSNEVSLSPSCTFTMGVHGRSKCNSLEGLGRALHGVQDFYSHSNWADQADSAHSTGITNPPGLNRAFVAPFLSLTASAPDDATIPRELSTGCFSLAPWGCGSRITHDTLNKDTGTISPVTGEALSPTTDRGQIGTNFSKAVRLAVLDTQRQWALFRNSLVMKYGVSVGRTMACALTHDDPSRDCIVA
nr:CinY protein [Streptomyces chartreusis]